MDDNDGNDLGADKAGIFANSELNEFISFKQENEMRCKNGKD